MNAFGKYENCSKPIPTPLKAPLIAIATLRNNCRNVTPVATLLKEINKSFADYRI